MTDDLTSVKLDIKICGVCGDRALGYNFNAITCESCKAFFRRNALKTKDFKCPFNDNCTVDVITRRFCQKCRLKKCFTIGMKKEWIMTEEEKKVKRAKIEENRHKKKSSMGRKSSMATLSLMSPSGSSLSSPPPSVSTIDPAGLISNASQDISSVFSEGENSSPPPLKRIRTVSTSSQDDNSQTVQNFDAVIVERIENPVIETEPEPDTVVVEGEGIVATLLSVSSPVSSKNDAENDDKMAEVAEKVAKIKKEKSAMENLPKPSSSGIMSDLIRSNSPVNTLMQYTSLPTPSPQTPDNSTSRAGSPVSGLLKSSYQKQDYPPIAQEIINIAVEVEMTPISIRPAGWNSNQLTPLEKSKLDELVVANEVLKIPVVCEVTDPSLLDVINMTDHAIRRLIKMSKRIGSFKTLCQEDQIALLKGGCIELMILRSAMIYDSELNCWQGLQGPSCSSIKVDILKEARGNLYEEHKRFITSFDPLWRSNENIMLLLSAITLFTADRPNTVHKDAIKMEQCMYYYLLRRYLDTVYPPCEGRTIYLRLIQKLHELQDLNENHIRILLDVNPNDVEPLLIEIFDLKHLQQ